MHPQKAGFDEYCLLHTGHTEVKGSRYADPVIKENGKFRTDLKGKYGPDVCVNYINDYLKRQKRQQAALLHLLSHGFATLTDGANSRQS